MGSISWQSRFYNCLPAISFLFLTVNAADSAYRSRRDPSELAFIGFCYSDLVMLFLCLKSLERLGSDSPYPEKREGLKAAAWVLTTALNLAFSWRVAEIMPPVVAVLVWLMAGSVAVGGFYFLFIYSDADNNAGQAYSVLETKEPSPEGKV